MRLREDMLSKPVRDYLTTIGYTELYEEVPVFHCVMDVYGSNPTAGKTAAVEIKVSDWRRGVRQARVYQLCADVVYLAIHEKYAHRVCLDLLRKTGLGLLIVCVGQDARGSQHVRERLPASVSSIKRDYYVESLLGDIGGKDGRNARSSARMLA